MHGCTGVTCARVSLCTILTYLALSDRLRLLLPSCRVVKEFGIKACRECRFSHGGQMFAAVSGNTIGVYNTFTCEVVGNLRQAHVTPLPDVIVGHTSSVYNKKYLQISCPLHSCRQCSIGLSAAACSSQLRCHSCLMQGAQGVMAILLYEEQFCTSTCRQSARSYGWSRLLQRGSAGLMQGPQWQGQEHCVVP